MFRLIGILLVVALIGMLALRQLDGANESVADAAQEAGVELEAGAPPRDAARAVGRAVDATVAAGKARVDGALEGREEAEDDAR
jgi:hypothetical protein